MSLEQRLHWTYFVEGSFLLNSDEISLFDTNTSQQRLSAYYARMAQVYGEEYCTYNLHCATHMPDHVEELGPLWSISMFMFESFNSTTIRSFNKKLSTSNSSKAKYEEAKSYLSYLKYVIPIDI